MSNFTSYKMNEAQAVVVGACAVAPVDLRREFLEGYREKHGNEALIELVAQLFGMVMSLEKNTKEFVDLFCLTECKMHPHTVEKLNLPTLLGAVHGIENAVADPPPGMCGTCAFRLGSIANQCLTTALDARGCVQDRRKFLCHEVEGGGEPKQLCAGYAISRRDLVESIEASRAVEVAR